MPGAHGPNYGTLNIHYNRYISPELAPLSYTERMRVRLKPASIAVRELAISMRKSISLRKAVHRRHTSCRQPISDRVAAASPRPQVTQRNLDQSPFLSLPLEIRQQIYELYYESDVVKIQDLSYDGTYFLTATVPLSLRWPPGRGKTSYLWQKLLGLPLTCRTIYPEAMRYLYAKTSFRFTDPRLAMRVPDTIAMNHLQSISSIEFSFFLHLLVDYFARSEIRAVKSKLPSLGQKRAHSRKEATWPMLWSTISSLSNLKRISLQIYHDPSIPELEMHPWKSQFILEPFLQFDKGMGIKVAVNVCWAPPPTLVELFENAGYQVSLKADGMMTNTNVQRMRCSLRR